MRRTLRFAAYISAALLIFLMASSPSAHATTTDELIGSLTNRPALVVFYRSDSALCKQQLRSLPRYKAALPGWTITVASLTKPDKKLSDDLESQHVALINLSTSKGTMILQSLGDTQGAVPFSVALRPNPVPANEVCARWIGDPSDKLAEWAQSCAQ